MNVSETLDALRRFARRDGAVLGASRLLHGFLLLFLVAFAHRLLPEPSPFQHFIPVSLVAESEGPGPTPRPARAAGAISKAQVLLPRAPIAHRSPSAVAPRKAAAPPDDLEIQLKALSKLRMPNTDTRLLGAGGTSSEAESGADGPSGGEGAYSTRDIIRAQVLRRWSLDMRRLGTRNFDILLRVLLKRDGTVVKADIVDANRYKTDSAFRWIATSAKNAVILSSPLTLPPNIDQDNLQLTLTLN